MTTCLGGGAQQRAAARPMHHHAGCPVLLGAEWRCDCPGPYCGEHCDGSWVTPDGGAAAPVSAVCDECNVAG